MTVRIIIGNALERLRELPDESVPVWITSPPYWGLRDYDTEPLVWGGDAACEHMWEDTTYVRRSNDEKPGEKQLTNKGSSGRDKPVHNAFCQLCGAWAGSLGLEPTIDLYIQHLVEIFREARRVLRKDGTLWVNLGDSYATGSAGTANMEPVTWIENGKPKKVGMTRIGPVPGLKPKDLCGIPWRVALALQADGWWLRSACPWVKKNCLPESVSDRPVTSHEYWFLFARSGDTQYWTHRDGLGTRTKPKPDYRWIHVNGEERIEEPDGNWKRQKADCPKCGGTGVIGVEAFGQEFISTPCGRCKGKKRVKAWQRVNLWKGHDYFWDGEGVKKVAQYPNDDRKPYAPGSVDARGNGHDRGGGIHTGRDASGRNRRTSDFFFESLEAEIAQCERHLAHLKHIRDNGGLLLDENGDPLALNVPTWGYKGSHFATFPADLIEPLIKASSSEKGCCPKCGAAWEQVTEKEFVPQPDIKNPASLIRDPATMDQSSGWGGSKRGSNKTLTTGWFPTCDCPAHEPVPCVVGDMFGGAATVGLVADRLGRDALLIELNEEYAEMGRQRIAEDAGPMLLDLEIIENSEPIGAEQLKMFA